MRARRVKKIAPVDMIVSKGIRSRNKVKSVLTAEGASYIPAQLSAAVWLFRVVTSVANALKAMPVWGRVAQLVRAVES